MPPIVRCQTVKGRGPTVTFRYTTEFRAYLNKYDSPLVYGLCMQITVPPAAQATEWEYLDSMHDRMLTAERNCRKLRMGEIPWSPQYQLIRAKLHAWNLLRKRANGGHVDSRMMRQLKVFS
jgi:hypothetical protein